MALPLYRLPKVTSFLPTVTKVSTVSAGPDLTVSPHTVASLGCGKVSMQGGDRVEIVRVDQGTLRQNPAGISDTGISWQRTARVLLSP